MAATLKLTHKTIGVEVRRGTYDVVVDGARVGSVELNDTIEIPVEPGRHTLGQHATRRRAAPLSPCQRSVDPRTRAPPRTVIVRAIALLRQSAAREVW
jgi:hypothetical protein